MEFFPTHIIEFKDFATILLQLLTKKVKETDKILKCEESNFYFVIYQIYVQKKWDSWQFFDNLNSDFSQFFGKVYDCHVRETLEE